MNGNKEKDNDILYVDVDELFRGKGVDVNISKERKTENKTFINKEKKTDDRK